MAVSVLLAVAGIANNLPGFTGITAFARYLVAPPCVDQFLLPRPGLRRTGGAGTRVAPAVPRPGGGPPPYPPRISGRRQMTRTPATGSTACAATWPAGTTPTGGVRYARLPQGYEIGFWNTLADRAR